MHKDDKIHLRAPAWKLPEGSGIGEVLWGALRGKEQRVMLCTGMQSHETLGWPEENLSFAVKRRLDESMSFQIKVCSQSLALPCLGFLHYVLVQESLLPSHQAGLREGLRRALPLLLPEGLVRKGGQHPCNDAAEGGEFQRALSALLMRHRSRWQFRVECCDPTLGFL